MQLNNPVYTNDRIEEIKCNIHKNILKRGKYRRQDMPSIVRQRRIPNDHI